VCQTIKRLQLIFPFHCFHFPQLYFERETPEKPQLPTIFDIIRMTQVARRIQNVWVMRQCEKRMALEAAEAEAYADRLVKPQRSISV
jgi:hypothetical protein